MARRFLRKLISYLGGDHQVWSLVRVPSREEEDGRRVHRELERLKKERGGHRNRIRSFPLFGTIGLSGSMFRVTG